MLTANRAKPPKIPRSLRNPVQSHTAKVYELRKIAPHCIGCEHMTGCGAGCNHAPLARLEKIRKCPKGKW